MAYKQQNLLLIVVEGWKSEMTVPAWLGSGEIPLLCCRILVGFSHSRKRVREPSGVVFKKTLIPFMRAPPSWPNHLPKTLPHNIVTLGIRISIYEFEGDTTIQSTVHSNHLHTEKLRLRLLPACPRSCKWWTAKPALKLQSETKVHMGIFPSSVVWGN